ncbi:hypothetical protein SNEBB_002364 [Seison nebaliae]|nr:hypothetical protein SNEBB_002364 [Seison nebaliae]
MASKKIRSEYNLNELNKMANEEVQCSFEGYDITADDRHGVHLLLHQNFKYLKDFPFEAVTGYLIEEGSATVLRNEAAVGTSIRLTAPSTTISTDSEMNGNKKMDDEKDGDDDDEEEEEDDTVYAVTGLIPLQIRTNSYRENLSPFFRELAGNDSKNKKLLEKLNGYLTPETLFLINLRFLNIPMHVFMPLINELVESEYESEYLILMYRVFKESNKKKNSIIYIQDEYELFEKYSVLHFTTKPFDNISSNENMGINISMKKTNDLNSDVTNKSNNENDTDYSVHLTVCVFPVNRLKDVLDEMSKILERETFDINKLN